MVGMRWVGVKDRAARATALAACVIGIGVAGCATSRGGGEHAVPTPDPTGSSQQAPSPSAALATKPASPATSTKEAVSETKPEPARRAGAKEAADPRCSPVHQGPVDQYVAVLDWGIPRFPQYPPQALVKDISGTVRVHVLVGTDGKICKSEVLEGPQLLHEAALQAASETHLSPAMKNGRPVPIWVVIPFQFTLPPSHSSTKTAKK